MKGLSFDQINRLAYDGNYEIAIKALVSILKEQDTIIREQTKKLSYLEKKIKLAEQLVINPALESKADNTDLNIMLSEFQDNN